MTIEIILLVIVTMIVTAILTNYLNSKNKQTKGVELGKEDLMQLIDTLIALEEKRVETTVKKEETFKVKFEEDEHIDLQKIEEIEKTHQAQFNKESQTVKMTKEEQIRFSKNLKFLRLKYGHSGKGVAKIIGVVPSGYSSYETGRCVPRRKTFNKILDLYNITEKEIKK